MAVCYAPMIALRLLARRIGIDFGAMIEDPTWVDTVASFVVGTGFNVLLTFFVVSAYLDRLCEHMFETRGVNLGIFHGRFHRKITLALLFVAFAGMILLQRDIACYWRPADPRGHPRRRRLGLRHQLHLLLDHPRLSRPIARLDHGMRQIAKGDYACACR